jgi:hypothetical protein
LALVVPAALGLAALAAGFPAGDAAGAFAALGLAALGAAAFPFVALGLALPRLATLVGVSSGMGLASLRIVRARSSSTNELKELTSMPARPRWTMTSFRVRPLMVLANW